MTSLKFYTFAFTAVFLVTSANATPTPAGSQVAPAGGSSAAGSKSPAGAQVAPSGPSHVPGIFRRPSTPVTEAQIQGAWDHPGSISNPKIARYIQNYQLAHPGLPCPESMRRDLGNWLTLDFSHQADRIPLNEAGVFIELGGPREAVFVDPNRVCLTGDCDPIARNGLRIVDKVPVRPIEVVDEPVERLGDPWQTKIERRNTGDDALLQLVLQILLSSLGNQGRLGAGGGVLGGQSVLAGLGGGFNGFPATRMLLGGGGPTLAMPTTSFYNGGFAGLGNTLPGRGPMFAYPQAGGAGGIIGTQNSWTGLAGGGSYLSAGNFGNFGGLGAHNPNNPPVVPLAP